MRVTRSPRPDGFQPVFRQRFCTFNKFQCFFFRTSVSDKPAVSRRISYLQFRPVRVCLHFAGSASSFTFRRFLHPIRHHAFIAAYRFQYQKMKTFKRSGISSARGSSKPATTAFCISFYRLYEGWHSCFPMKTPPRHESAPSFFIFSSIIILPRIIGLS